MGRHRDDVVVMSMWSGDDYRAGLGDDELVGAIGELVAVEREVEHLLCRYLADLADRLSGGAVSASLRAYGDVYHAARCLFGMGVRRTRERIRIGRALRELPSIEAAFVAGDLAYSRVREVTRVATPDDERAWLEAAQRLPFRQLEQRVAEAGDSEGRRARAASKAEEPAALAWISRDVVEVHVTMTAEAWGLLERAMEGARMASDGEGLLSDAEALEAVARDALARQQGEAEASDPRRTVVLYECQRCRKTELDTGAGAVPLDHAAAATLGCCAPERDLASEGLGVSRGGAVPVAMKRAVRLRDRNRCRVVGCNRRRYVDVHHIEGRAEGGLHARSNLCLLCTTHHRMLHEGALSIEGDAEGELTFRGADGQPLDGRDPIGSSSGEAAVQRQILSLVGGRGSWHPDALIEATGVATHDLLEALVVLELSGKVIRDPGGYVRAAG